MKIEMNPFARSVSSQLILEKDLYVALNSEGEIIAAAPASRQSALPKFWPNPKDVDKIALYKNVPDQLAKRLEAQGTRSQWFSDGAQAWDASVKYFKDYVYESINEDGVPDKVKEIADAIKRENPGISDEKKMSIAWATYNKMHNGKGSEVDRNIEASSVRDIEYDGAKFADEESSADGSFKKKTANLIGNKYDEDEATNPDDERAFYAYESNAGNDWGLAYKDDIIEFFRKNPEPTDRDVHQFATDLGLEPWELEREIYKLTSDMLANKLDWSEQIDPTRDMMRGFGMHKQFESIDPQQDINFGAFSYLVHKPLNESFDQAVKLFTKEFGSHVGKNRFAKTLRGYEGVFPSDSDDRLSKIKPKVEKLGFKMSWKDRGEGDGTFVKLENK